MWNLKAKHINKHKKAETVIDAKNKQVVARGEVGGRRKEIDERV